MSWVEIEMSWVGMDGAGWSWVELSGGGWIWVEVGSRFSNTQKIENLRNRIDLIIKNNKKNCLKWISEPIELECKNVKLHYHLKNQ